MGSTKASGSVLAIRNRLEVEPQKCLSEECEPVTLQVVLLGSDGIIIASDTCAANFNPPYLNFTDSVSKIIVTPRLVYTFAGDSCARDIGAAVASKAGTSQLSVDIVVLSSQVADQMANPSPFV